MNEAGIRQYAAKLGIALDARIARSGWTSSKCPFAHWRHNKGLDRSPSFGILVKEDGRSAYKCFSCHSHGSLPKLAYDLAKLRDDDSLRAIGLEVELAELHTATQEFPEWDADEESEKSVILPDKGLAFATYPPALLYADAIDYCGERRIYANTMMRLALRWDSYQRRVLFPAFDRYYRFRGFTGRMIGTPDPPEHPKVRDYFGLPKEQLMLGEERAWKHRGHYKFLIIVEGPFDYANVIECGYPNVVCLLGSYATSAKLRTLEAIGLPIIWFVDNDEAGLSCLWGVKEDGERRIMDGALYKLRENLTQSVVNYPNKKYNDPGQLDRRKITKLVKNAELYTT